MENIGTIISEILLYGITIVSLAILAAFLYGAITRPKTPNDNTIPEKSTATAIVFNLILPGAGYIYFNKPFVGTAALLYAIAVAVAATQPASNIAMNWLILNIIMAIDMAMLNKKRRAAGQTDCPFCAETIKIDAKICKHCGSELPQKT